MGCPPYLLTPPHPRTPRQDPSTSHPPSHSTMAAPGHLPPAQRPQQGAAGTRGLPACSPMTPSSPRTLFALQLPQTLSRFPKAGGAALCPEHPNLPPGHFVSPLGCESQRLMRLPRVFFIFLVIFSPPPRTFHPLGHIYYLLWGLQGETSWFLGSARGDFQGITRPAAGNKAEKDFYGIEPTPWHARS